MPDHKKDSLFLLAPVLLVVLNIFLFGPFGIYQGNLTEFQVPLLNLIITFLLPALICFVVLTAVGVVFKFNQRYISILLALGMLIWFQGNILVWKYGLLDGQGINWQSGIWRGWLDGSIWILAIVLAIVFYKHVFRIAKFLSIMLLSLQFLLLAAQTVRKPEIWKTKENFEPAKKPPPEIFEFSSKKNVILIILDGFQSDIFQEIVEEHPEYYSIFKGFTFFKDTLGVFPTTKMSIPAILTAKVYKNQAPMSRFMKKKIYVRTIHSQMKGAGFHVDLICGKMYRGRKAHFSQHFEISRPYGATRKAYYLSNSALVLDLVLFRSSPHFLKKGIYNNQSWFLQKLIDREALSSFHYISHMRFFNDFITKMAVSKETPVYKYMHLAQSHPPIVVNKNCEFTGKIYPVTRQALKMQATCGLHQIIEFFDKLKALGIYDSSTLVIFADHGANTPAKIANYNVDKAIKLKSAQIEIAKIIGSAAPLMLIKKAGIEGPMIISDAQTRLSDLPQTICSLLGVKSRFDGRSMFDIKATEKRIRKFYYYKWKHKNWAKEYFDLLQEYIVEGPMFDLNSWRKGKTLYPKHANQSL